jgi:hypothetical protein
MHASYILGLLLIGALFERQCSNCFSTRSQAILLEAEAGLVVCYLQVYSFAGLQSSSSRWQGDLNPDFWFVCEQKVCADAAIETTHGKGAPAGAQFGLQD